MTSSYLYVSANKWNGKDMTSSYLDVSANKWNGKDMTSSYLYVSAVGEDCGVYIGQL